MADNKKNKQNFFKAILEKGLQKFGIGGAVGTAAGAYFGGPMGASIGGSLGSMLDSSGGDGGGMTGAMKQYRNNQAERQDAVNSTAYSDYMGSAVTPGAPASGMALYRPALTEALGKQAMGEGPSIADAQLKMAMNRNLQQQIAATKANRSLNPALAARSIATQGAANTQAIAGQSAIDKMQEQRSAQQALASWNAQLASIQQGQAGAANQAMAINNQAAQYGQTRADQITAGQLTAASGLAGALATGFGSKSGGGNNAANNNDIASMAAQSPDASGFEASDAGGFSGTGGVYKAEGGKIPGKAEVSGDSEKNDKVPAMLSPGEIVIPRSVVAKGHKASAEFVKEILAKETQKKNLGGITSDSDGYADGGKIFGNSNQVAAYNDGGTVKTAEPKPWYADMFTSDNEGERKIGEGVKKGMDPNKAKGLASVFNADNYAKGGKVPKLGTGKRFAHLEKQLAGKGAKDPKALAAYIGREKFGAKKMSALAQHKKMAEGGAVPEVEGHNYIHEKNKPIREDYQEQEKDYKYLRGAPRNTEGTFHRGDQRDVNEEDLTDTPHDYAQGGFIEALGKARNPENIKVNVQKLQDDDVQKAHAGFAEVLAAQAHLHKKLSDIAKKYGSK